MRKFELNLISRNHLASLTERAKNVTGIPMIHEVDKEMIERILLD